MAKAKITNISERESELINYSVLSEMLTGRKDVVRSNRVQKKHKDKVNELHSFIKYWMDKHNLK